MITLNNSDKPCGIAAARARRRLREKQTGNIFGGQTDYFKATNTHNPLTLQPNNDIKRYGHPNNPNNLLV